MLPLTEQVQEKLRDQGYVVLGEADFGLCHDDRQSILAQYFREDVLAPEHPGMRPVDRLRARDVVGYARTDDGGLRLWKHTTVALTTPDGLPGEHLHGVERNFKRVDILAHDGLRRWTAGVLSVIPAAHQFAEGTFGVNLFRTFTSVVSGPHRDNARYFVVYVLGKKGEGAETTLHSPDDPATVLVETTLYPGAIIIVDDERYLHSVSRLIGDDCQRDALVGMVYYA